MLPLATLTLTLLTLSGRGAGAGWLEETNTWSNVFYGFLCVDAPPVDATCGWQMIVTSDPVLGSITPYDAIVTKLDGGRTFYLENQHWNAADPDNISHYCTEVQISGSFGNTKPDYVNVDWHCICVSTTCDPVPTVTTTVASVTSTSSPAPVFSTTGPTTATSSIASFYVKHTAKCHVVPTSTQVVTYRLMCFRKCLHLTGCNGVNVRDDALGYVCSYVTEVFHQGRLTESGSSTCNFWQKL